MRVNIKYLSLNARDLQIVTNDYPAPHVVPQDVVPVSGERDGLLRQPVLIVAQIAAASSKRSETRSRCIKSVTRSAR